MITRKLEKWRAKGGSDYDGFYFWVNDADVEYLLNALSAVAKALVDLQTENDQLRAAAQEQASDEPASYPGELWSDGPYKEQMRYDRRDGRGGWGPW
jgi:hypothetical protein